MFYEAESWFYGKKLFELENKINQSFFPLQEL